MPARRGGYSRASRSSMRLPISSWRFCSTRSGGAATDDGQDRPWIFEPRISCVRQPRGTEGQGAARRTRAASSDPRRLRPRWRFRVRQSLSAQGFPLDLSPPCAALWQINHTEIISRDRSARGRHQAMVPPSLRVGFRSGVRTCLPSAVADLRASTLTQAASFLTSLWPRPLAFGKLFSCSPSL